MSVNIKKVEPLENEDNSNNKDNSTSLNKPLLNPVKVNKSTTLDSSKNKALDIKNKFDLFLEQDQNLIKNNNLFNYLNSINSKRSPFLFKNFSPKSRNSSNLISNNISVTKSKSPKKIKNLENYSPKVEEIYQDNSNYIKLNSLFTLPPITKKSNPNNNSHKTINTSNYNLITENNQNRARLNSLDNKKMPLAQIGNNFRQIKNKQNKEDTRHNNIHSFMKLKYYEDVNEKYEKKLRDDSFIDRGVKEKIIKIGKVGIFWRNVIEYCGSFIFAEKFKNIKKQFKKKYEKKDDDYNYKINKYNKTPNRRLYTNLLVNKIIHYQNKNKDKDMV